MILFHRHKYAVFAVHIVPAGNPVYCCDEEYEDSEHTVYVLRCEQCGNLKNHRTEGKLKS